MVGICYIPISRLLRRRQWHSTPVLLPGKSHGQRSLVGYSPWGHYESDMTERLHFHFSLSCTGEGNGDSLQCSCLENPRVGGAWLAAVSGVAQSRTQLKWLSSLAGSLVCWDSWGHRVGYHWATELNWNELSLDIRGNSAVIKEVWCGASVSLGEGNGNTLQYCCLENLMDGGALVGYSPQGHKESNMTERLHYQLPWWEH